MSDEPARRQLRLLTRTRGGYNGAIMYDVQLQEIATRQLLWAQTFSDHAQAERFRDDVEADLATLDAAAFRRKYGVPASV